MIFPWIRATFACVCARRSALPLEGVDESCFDFGGDVGVKHGHHRPRVHRDRDFSKFADLHHDQSSEYMSIKRRLTESTIAEDFEEAFDKAKITRTCWLSSTRPQQTSAFQRRYMPHVRNASVVRRRRNPNTGRRLP
jgi:hypothetical protein